jgi:hypothetical protein
MNLSKMKASQSENTSKEEFGMIVKTAVNKYINTSKEIFLQSGLDFVSVNKEENVERQFGYSVSHAKVKKIDEDESPDAVTIYF